MNVFSQGQPVWPGKALLPYAVPYAVPKVKATKAWEDALKHVYGIKSGASTRAVSEDKRNAYKAKKFGKTYKPKKASKQPVKTKTGAEPNLN